MIHVTPLSRLVETLETSRARHVVSLLSVGTVFERPAHLRPEDCLHLSMHDIVEKREGYVAPAREHIESLLAFARNWDRATPLVVHCYAGISRSPAAAYVIAAALNPERNAADLAQELRRLSPAATPNLRIVALADKLLDRGGALTRAISTIGRGAEASEGVPFAISLSGRPVTSLGLGGAQEWRFGLE
nr:protein tyrosine phosphatase [Mesorhizobium sp.]